MEEHEAQSPEERQLAPMGVSAPDVVADQRRGPALAVAIGNRATARLVAGGSNDSARRRLLLARALGSTQVRVLSRQGTPAPAPAPGVSVPAPPPPPPAVPPAPARPALTSTAQAVLAEVRTAMGAAQTEGGGVGDFPRAFRALVPLSLDDLVTVLRELARTHETQILAGHMSEAPQDHRQRLEVALEGAILLEEPPQTLTESTVSRAASALASADPALRDQTLRAIISARVGPQLVAMTMEGLSLMMAAVNLPALNPGLVGVRGPVTPGPWAPPGLQPIPFYLGTTAHLAIAAEYTIQNPGDVVRTNTVSIARILTELAGVAGGPTPNRSALDGERLGSEPDIANLTKRHIYEIKPAGAAALARSEARWYVESFTLAGIPMALGPAAAPGTTGAVPAPGGVYLFESPEPGVILYQLRRMQVERVPVPRSAPEREPRFRLAPLTQQQQQQMVTTMAVGTMGLILLMILLAPIGV